jgi:hypothetical protein
MWLHLSEKIVYLIILIQNLLKNVYATIITWIGLYGFSAHFYVFLFHHQPKGLRIAIMVFQLFRNNSALVLSVFDYIISVIS